MQKISFFQHQQSHKPPPVLHALYNQRTGQLDSKTNDCYNYSVSSIVSRTVQLRRGKKQSNEGPNSATADKIIQAAINLFAVKGFKGSSIRDIALESGMSLYNIYYYFENKDGLLLAILKSASQPLIQSLRDVSELDIDPLERFELLVKTHVDRVRIHMKEARIFFLDEDHLTQEARQLSQTFQNDILDIYKKQLQILKELGHLDYEHVAIVALNILGVINWSLRWYRSDGPLFFTDLCKEIVRFALHGALHNISPAVNEKSGPTSP